MAHVSDEDKAKMRRVAADLALAETDEPGSVADRRRTLATANELRRAAGVEPLPDEEDDPPELEFNRRAAALGMARTYR